MLYPSYAPKTIPHVHGRRRGEERGLGPLILNSKGIIRELRECVIEIITQ